MPTPFLLLCALAIVPNVDAAPEAETKTKPKPKATKAKVATKKATLENASAAMRDLASQPAPKGLTAEQGKVYAAEMKAVGALADECDAVVLEVSEGLAQKRDLETLAEMTEMEAVRLQMAMDRLAKVLETLSNLLKKQSETASGIIQNMK